MKPSTRVITVVATALIVLLAYGWLTTRDLERLPEVTFTLIDGNRLSPAALRDRPLLVTFWATTCRSCRKEIPHLIELYNEYREQGLELIAVAMAYDPPTHVVEFSRQNKLPYRVAFDLDGALARAFGDVSMTPTTFVIARDGRVVHRKVGAFDAQAIHTLLAQLVSESPQP